MTATAARMDEAIDDLRSDEAPAPAGDDGVVEELRRRLGRPAVQRSAGRIAIDLDAGGAWASALWLRSEGRLRLAFVTDDLVSGSLCEQAVLRLLARAASAVCGVEVDEAIPALVAHTDGGAIDALVLAVEQLTVAARMTAAEVEALSGDEELARRYLSRELASGGTTLPLLDLHPYLSPMSDKQINNEATKEKTDEHSNHHG